MRKSLYAAKYNRGFSVIIMCAAYTLHHYMTKSLLPLFLSVFLLAACGEITLPVADDLDTPDVEQPGKTRKFTFTVKGDFISDFNSRAVTNEYMAVDGTEMTDLWVYDVMDGEIVHTLHQTPADADWGKPSFPLSYGDHHVFFLASNGQTPTVKDNVVTWQKNLDTFYLDYEVSVGQTTNGNRAVTLQRIATRLKITIDDAIAVGTRAVAVAPSEWYDGINVITGELHAATGEKSAVMYDSDEGQRGITLSYYWLCPADEYTTDITVTARDADGAAISTATIADAAFKRNRTSAYHGGLYGASFSGSVTLDGAWLPTLEGGQW